MNNIKHGIKLFLLFFFISGLLFVTVFGCSLFSKRYEKKEVKEYSINTAGKKSLSVNNVNGSIKVLKNTSDSTLHVKVEIISYVTKKNMDKTDDETMLKIDSSGDEINFDYEYIREKRFFHFDIGKKDKINYEFSIPQNIHITVDNTNGKIDIENVTNNMKLDLINGDVTLTNASGNLDVDVTNGKIKGDLDSTKGMNLKSINGSITLNLGSTFAGNFKADCIDGKVVVKDLDFKNFEQSNKTFEGKLGDSDNNVKLETIKGKIYLNKR